MKITLVSDQFLPRARRQMRQYGIRLTVRYGNIYTMRAVKPHQPDTEAQLAMRSIMAQASSLAKNEMANPERRQYWAAQAAILGYKTPRGACIAHHIARLRTETASANAQKPDVAKNSPQTSARHAARFPHRRITFPYPAASGTPHPSRTAGLLGTVIRPKYNYIWRRHHTATCRITPDFCAPASVAASERAPVPTEPHILLICPENKHLSG